MLPLADIFEVFGKKFIAIFFDIGLAIMGVITVWFGTIVFSWFGLKSTILMVIILGIGSLLNSLNRLKATTQEQFLIELSSSASELVGIMIGGIFFL